ncbi:UMP kinase [Candidatus Pacearchaeota archaeon]|nr:UMP kinase [Candidatus Pacearchaeota archaeon]
MKRSVWVISLGGSIISSKEGKINFLGKFKDTLEKYYSKYRFVIVCGGGDIARHYINILSREHKSENELSKAGILATRANAEFVMRLFGKEANDKLPKTIHQVKNNLLKNNVVICGALRFTKNSTSDTNAARIAKQLKAPFINITNVDGLYTSNPLANSDAKLISFISWRDFENKAVKIKYKNGQHFVLDQKSAIIIRKNRIKTYIINSRISDLRKVIEGKNFHGTRIKD